MKRQLRTSLVIPSFNSFRFLPELIAALEMLSPQPDQVVFVDDCSTDLSANRFEWLVDSARLSSQIDVVRRSANGGSAAARNDGLDIARGEIVAFCDSDDLPLPFRMAIHQGDLVGLDGGVSYGAIAGFRDGTHESYFVRGGWRYRRGSVTKNLLRRNFVPFSTVAVSGSARDTRFGRDRLNEDWPYLIEQSLSFEFHTQRKPMTVYRHSLTQKTHGAKRHDVVSALRDVSPVLLKRGEQELARIADRRASSITKYRAIAELPALYREIGNWVPSRLTSAKRVDEFLARVQTRAAELGSH